MKETMMTSKINHYQRLRRLRVHPALRDLLCEVNLSVNDLVLPLFVKAGEQIRNPISTLKGHYQFSVDQLDDEIKNIQSLNIPGVLLFGLPAYKDAIGSAAWQEDGVVQQALRRIKVLAPELLLIADLCFCEYTDHGHCGVLAKDHCGHSTVDNEATLPLLARQAVSLVEAGADVIAPSGMQDGMVATVRAALDAAGYSHIPIISYAVKYASCFYGPFREAALGSPQQGDRKTYQMDPANSAEALREACQDVAEGADMLMVKPAQHYLDIIAKVTQACPTVPLCAYQVSGEYAMIVAAAQLGWLDEQAAMLESLLAIKRAGARFIITYFAKQAAAVLQG